MMVELVQYAFGCEGLGEEEVAQRPSFQRHTANFANYIAVVVWSLAGGGPDAEANVRRRLRRVGERHRL